MQKLISAILVAVLILASCKLKESTDTGVEPTSGSTLSITSPNGGEELMEGNSYDITWSSSNVNNYLKIQFTVNNGSTWATIVDSAENVGTYAWFPIPNTISNQCKIRISSVDNSVQDTSNATFSIVRNSNESLALSVPNGGESWEAGTDKEIKWYSSGIDSVKLEYTTNNGNNWLTIAVDTFNTGIYYWEPIPNTPSTLAKIRIKDAKDGSPADESDNTFNILPEPSIRVKVPNGGETWVTGTEQKIEWDAENIENVRIAYTVNGGAQWHDIIASTPNTGFYNWTSLPDTNSAQCKIRVYDAKDDQPFDVSDNAFTITNQVAESITLISPNAGTEVYEAGTNETITWSFTGSIQNIKIELSTNSGQTWSTIEASVQNTGAYEWNVPDTPSSLCKIRISDASDGVPSDVSENTFTINALAFLKLNVPNGGEVFRADEPFNIEWDYASVKNIDILYTSDNGANWFELYRDVPSNGTKEASFTIPSDQYKVRIQDSDGGSPSDESNGVFTILPKTSISLEFPNGGEEYLVGETYEIKWTSVNVARVKLEYTLNEGDTSSGSAWNVIEGNLLNQGYYNWTVPMVAYSSELCKVRATEYSSDPNENVAFDESDDFFRINTRYIRIVTPNGGENWDFTKPNRIEWATAGVDDVKIEYSLDNGQHWNVIEASYPNSGAYYWDPPDIASSGARIRISDVTDPSLIDESDGTFSLIAP